MDLKAGGCHPPGGHCCLGWSHCPPDLSSSSGAHPLSGLRKPHPLSRALSPAPIERVHPLTHIAVLTRQCL